GRDGDTIGRGQRARALEDGHQQQHGGEQQPVDARQIDLARHLLGGVADAETRQQAGLDRPGGGGGGGRGHGRGGGHRGGGGQGGRGWSGGRPATGPIPGTSERRGWRS